MIEARTQPRAWSTVGVEGICGRNLAEPRDVLYSAAKRTIDVLGSVLLLTLLAPLMALIALAIRLDSPGPAVFKQVRTGRWGREFVMLKFRSMYVDADQEVHRKFATQYINGSRTTGGNDTRGNLPVFKPANDKRISRVGKWLRRTSLDELPQFFNVLKGDMSVVGPRPELPVLVEQYEPWQRVRFAVPQGITGWWQVNGRSDKPMHLNTEDDIYYVRHFSLLLDIQIILKTVWVMLRGKGAY